MTCTEGSSRRRWATRCGRCDGSPRATTSWRRRFAALGHKVSSSTIPKLLEELKYCRHSNRKTKEAGKHPDRDAQFEYINAKVEAFQAAGEPVISIDAKKKELLGEFKNGGSDYGPQGEPIEVNAHDFEDKELGKVVPYGVYDIGANLGYISLGI